MSHRYNGLHTNYRNEVFTNQITSDTTYYYNYLVGNQCEQVQSRILNREIGDEELFLDNNTINGVASYSALIQIHVNAPHPYYNFDGQIITTYKIPGMYCRTDPFQTSSTGLAIFRSQNAVLFYGSSFFGNYEKEVASFYTCCPKKGFNNDELDIITQANVSPNPILAGEQVQIKSNVSVSAVKLYDTSGLFVAELVVSDSSDGTFFTTIPAVVPTGLYYINLYSEDEIIQSKLYIY